MSIETVEITSPGSFSVVEIRQGPAGTGGGGSNSITSATTSDGTADLSLLNVTTATATVSGTLTASHIHGNLAGNVYAHVRAGEALTKGDPVYVSGSHGSGSTLIAIVSKADASNAAKMPAVGIMDAAVANNANGHMVITGTITELTTDAYAINAELYVAAGGGMTATPPTARAQPVARVERSNLNNGAILVKVNGLSASDATPSTLVRRTANGDASFGAANTSSLTVTGGTTFGDESLIQFDAVEYYYGAGSAAAHRTALGSGATGDALFTAATPAAARTTLGLLSATATGTTAAASTTTDVVSITIPGAGFWKIEVFSIFVSTGSASTQMNVLFDSAATIPSNNFPIGSNQVVSTVGAWLVTSATLVASIGSTLATQDTQRNATANGMIRTTGASVVKLRITNTAGTGTSTLTQGALIATQL